MGRLPRCFVLLTLLLLAPRPAAALVQFEKVALPGTAGLQYTSLAIGPDRKLYATSLNGAIRRWPLLEDGTLGAAETITSLQDAEGGDRLLLGFVFDPASTAAAPIAWVTHSRFGFSDIADWAGKVTRLSGPNLESVQDFVVRLPRSMRDHATNGITFGPDGALYFMQGSNSTTGAPDTYWGNRPERLLSAAVLRLDPTLVGSPPLDARTEDGGAYDPYATGAPLTLFATGTRNAYDLVWHSNGQLYVPTNGSGSSGNTPAGNEGASCANGGSYAGPAVPSLAGVGLQRDYLFRVVAGGYYGHPNPLRCNFVLNGGNPTAGSDPAEVLEYAAGTLPDANYRGFAYDFGEHRSPNGIIEYRSFAFEGELRGKLLVIRYSVGDDIIVLTPGAPDQDIVAAQTGITGLTGFADPLDLVENPRTGCLYVSEYAASKITLLRPVPFVISVEDPVFASVALAVAPNPGPNAQLSFVLPEAADVDLAVFDVKGRRVATLLDGPLAAGTHGVSWDGRDSHGQPTPFGLYFHRLRIGSVSRIVRAVKLD